MPGPRKTCTNKGHKRGAVLTDKQRQMLDFYYANGCNKRAAMRHVGYSPSSIQANSYQVWGHRNVVAEMARREKAVREKYELNEDWVIQRLMKLADGNLGEILIKLEANNGDLAALTETERYVLDQHEPTKFGTKIKLADRIGPLIALCRKMGLFKDSVEVSGSVSLVERLQRGRDQARQAKDGV